MLKTLLVDKGNNFLAFYGCCLHADVETSMGWQEAVALPIPIQPDRKPSISRLLAR